MRTAHRHALRYASAYFGTQGIGFTRHADSCTRINNAVRIATDGDGAYVHMQNDLFAIAQRASTPKAGPAMLTWHWRA